MPTDDKNKMGRPDLSSTTSPNPAPNVAPDPFARPKTTPVVTATGDLTSSPPPDLGNRTRMGDANLGGHYPVGGAPTAEDVGRTVRETGRRAAESAHDIAGEIDATTDQLAQLWGEVNPWISDVVQHRPVAITAGAFAAGYVLAGGIPRMLVRMGVRVGLPLAAAFWIARSVSSIDADDFSEPVVR